jgi:hypothetical protein
MQYVTRMVAQQIPRVRVIRDSDPEEPELEFLTILHWHRKYGIHSDAVRVDMSKYEADDDEELGVDEEQVQGRLASDYDLVAWWPLYMLDHSGVRLSLKPFSCPWDSGQVGIVGITRAQWDATQTEPWTGVRSQWERAKLNATGDIDCLDRYMNGDMWGSEVVDDTGEVVNGCWGFYGTDWDNGMADHIDEEYHELLREALANPEE